MFVEKEANQISNEFGAQSMENLQIKHTYKTHINARSGFGGYMNHIERDSSPTVCRSLDGLSAPHGRNDHHRHQHESHLHNAWQKVRLWPMAFPQQRQGGC